MTHIDNGYGGYVSFVYTQISRNDTFNIWTRQAITKKIIDLGIGHLETYTYAFTGNPEYKGDEWDQEFRGWNEVKVTDTTGAYVKHWFYTTGTINNKEADKLTGKEYQTRSYDSGDTLLKESTYNWTYENPAGNVTMTFYPDPDAELTCVDGAVRVRGGETSGWPWSTAHNHNGSEASPSVATQGIAFREYTDHKWWMIQRSITGFDTSGIPENAEIVSAVISIYGSSKLNSNNYDPDIGVYTATPESNTNLPSVKYNLP
ncbi:hypothetical protein JXI42_05005 [bacterium]|nr:hypothetical protein [bacterium]